MKKILFIHDHSPKSLNALKFAVSITGELNAQLLLAQTGLSQHAGQEKIFVENAKNRSSTLTEPLMDGNALDEYKEIMLRGMDTQQIAQLINREEIWMIIKVASESNSYADLNIDTILNRVQCPLLLIPESWSYKEPRHITYLADLRYCRTEIVRFMAQLSGACNADLSVTHLTKEGMVHIDKTYAHQLFNEQVHKQVNNARLQFNYTCERDLAGAVDVLTNGMHHDLLVMSKNRYHFNKLIGPAINHSLPANISVPLLVFPG